MRIAGTGRSVPEEAVANPVLESRLGLEAGWIERRTGVLCRPMAPPGQATSDLAVEAGQRALAAAGLPPGRVGLLVLATSTPDHLLPPTAPLVASRLGLAGAGAFDLAGACSGFLYALILAEGWGGPRGRPVLVIGANLLSRRVDPCDRATAPLFADGAGAVVLEPCRPSLFLGSCLGSDGSAYDWLGIPAGGTREPLTEEAVAAGRHLMQMPRGRKLFRRAVAGMAAAGREALEDAGMGAAQVDWWVPHQASLRIIGEAGELLGIPPARTVRVIDRHANSSAATIPIALDHAVIGGMIRRGQLLLLTAAGAGLISAGLVLRY